MRRRLPMRRCLFAALLMLLLTPVARAVQPDEMLANPVLEARAQALSRQLRCLVCQNETIDDSNADLAHDLRVLVRQRLLAGDSDQQVLQFLRQRYGDYVLLKPPFELATYALWLGPGVVLLAGLAGIGVFLRRRAAVEADPLSADEHRRLDRLLLADQAAKDPE